MHMIIKIENYIAKRYMQGKLNFPHIPDPPDPSPEEIFSQISYVCIQT